VPLLEKSSSARVPGGFYSRFFCPCLHEWAPEASPSENRPLLPSSAHPSKEKHRVSASIRLQATARTALLGKPAVAPYAVNRLGQSGILILQKKP